MYEHRYPDWDDAGQVIMWPTDVALATDWWRHYLANARFEDHVPRVRATTASEKAAWDLVNRLVRTGDSTTVPMLVAIAEAAPDREALFFLGAGPLEDLVRAHGDRLAPRLVDAAARSNRFKIALSGVWPDEEDPLPESAMAVLRPYLGDDETTPFG